MRIAAHAAAALVDANDNDGPARLYDRELETGMVVTYARPYVESNEAGVGKKWWPTGDDRELHDELMDLRHEYHAHASHTPRRRLVNTTALFGDDGRPSYSEQWELLPTWKLNPLNDLATRQAERFEAAADALDLELFGPYPADN